MQTGKYLDLKILGAGNGARQVSGTKIAAVRFVEILLRADGDNPGWVNRFMAAVVVVADMGKTHRFRNARHLVDIAQETIQIEVIADAAFVALKVGHIDRVETHQGGPQTNIGFRQLATRQIAMLAQDLFQALQRVNTASTASS
jgi:hypothetical protein